MLMLHISPFVRHPMYDPEMGYSRRKESREIAEAIEESNRRIEGVTLGQLSAAGMVTLHVSCHQCQRRGRYRITGLIDKFSPTMELSKLKDLLAGNCPTRVTYPISGAVGFISLT